MGKGSSSGAIASMMLAQLFGKLVNFVLNILIVRATGARLVGMTTVPLALLLSTVQFLSREGVRCACMRVDLRRCSGDAAVVASVVNISWLVLPLAALIAPVACAAASAVGYSGVDAATFDSAARGFGLAAVIELAAEPVVNLLSACDKLPVRVASEAAALGAKALATYGLVVGAEAGASASSSL